MAVNRKKKGKPATGVVVIGFVIGLFILISTTVFFKTEKIIVTGSSIYSSDEIIGVTGIKPGDNLFRMNLSGCASKIESRLVYISHAKLKKIFPGTVVIDVSPSEPEANFTTETYNLVISSEGKVLEQCDSRKATLLNFTGTEPLLSLLPGDYYESVDEHKKEVIEQLLAFFTAEENRDIAENITEIDVTNRSEITYVYQDRITVNLGTINDLDYKIKFSDEIIRNKLGEETEGLLTILSDSSRASFLDKESIEKNEQIYDENIALINSQTEAEEETGEENTDSETVSHDPLME